MDSSTANLDTRTFLKSLGFPAVKVHQSFNHFDFSRASRRILVIGSMGSGKTEFSARIWRDSEIARKKTGDAARSTRTDGADRRFVFFIRSALDTTRFPDYPPDALPYRGGYVRCGKYIAEISSSFDLERVMEANPEVGTWVIDEASFYEERLAYVVERASRTRGLTFIFPSLV
ncbi:MAG TPA: thymidine kinase, partial [Spirochaetia bacterium]|nr:thymidine kinase [Spirochaetia bacterium]